MNDATFIIRRGRLIKDPVTRKVGDKELTTLTVALNPIGQKAKERYSTMFVDVTYSGRLGEVAAGLQKGDVFSASGCLMIREYTSQKGKGLAYEIPFPNDLIILQKQETDEEEEGPAAPPPAADTDPWAAPSA